MDVVGASNGYLGYGLVQGGPGQMTGRGLSLDMSAQGCTPIEQASYAGRVYAGSPSHT